LGFKSAYSDPQERKRKRGRSRSSALELSKSYFDFCVSGLGVGLTPEAFA